MLKCAEKAFGGNDGPSGSGRIPYPLLMIDTGHNFKEVTDFRDSRAKELGAELIVRSVEDSRARGTGRLAHPGESRTVHPTVQRVGERRGTSGVARGADGPAQWGAVSGALTAHGWTLGRGSCLVSAPVALRCQFPRGAKGGAVVTCPPIAGR